ncbi:hypothetical protein [uncultured Arcticibacterium sp.]|uniref:hypothetical protein n=1 Tax=uncultured Arcticibacterium sp. TaxID=2173042 RepID=UPI0030F800E6
MMNNILVIEHASSGISARLKCDKLEYNNQSKDEDIHQWLISNKHLLSAVKVLIISVRLGNEDAEFMGLYIGLHIRLTKELKEGCLLPILFITDDSKEDILSNQIKNHKEKSGLLLFTKGSYLLSAFSLEDYIAKPLSLLDEQTLLATVIPSLNIQNTKDLGHQLANDWGAFRLAKFAGYSLKKEKPSSLYFKYKDSLTNNDIGPNASTNIGLCKQACKALLIDDNSDSGWSEILGYIIKNKIVRIGQKTTLDVIKTFDEAMKFERFADYDVVFLDLRLLKEEDRANEVNDLSDLTGTKILRKIKDINSGIQVVIFTASNKVWNIEKLLELGANGYYIKESPEYTQNDTFSKENYDELLITIKKSLSLKFLRRVAKIHKKCLQFILNDRSHRFVEYQNFYDRTKASFEIAEQLLNKVTIDEKYLNLAFLTYFQIVEDYVSQEENFKYVSKTECYVGNSRVRVVDNSTGNLIWKLTFKRDRFDGDYFEVFDEVKATEISIQTLAKVSFVLAFSFNQNTSFLKHWGYLNSIRNTKAGHGGDNGYVNIKNIEEILEVIELLFS